jgi:hypothetical protein
MEAANGSNVTAICLQVLQLAKGTVSAVLQTALTAVKRTYRLMWPQIVESLAGEIVLVCTKLQCYCMFSTALGTEGTRGS